MKSQQVKQSGELREKKREREKEISGLTGRKRDRALGRYGNDVGQKWPLEKLNS
jgi:hypothetical protein